MSDTFLHAEKPPHEPRALHAAKMVNASPGMRTSQSERTPFVLLPQLELDYFHAEDQRRRTFCHLHPARAE